MESLVLAPLLQVVFEKLASPILGELQSLKGFNKEIKKLQDRLPMIQAVIEDAEDRQLRDAKVKIWLTRLKNVAYDADDLLDMLTTQLLRKQLKKKVRILNLKPFVNYFKMSSELKDIRERLDDIAREMSDFQLKDAFVHRRYDIGDRRETGPYVNESEVFGRRKDLDAIVDMLFSSKSNHGRSEIVSIISIVGMGGIGKTTLAQLAYNEQRVMSHFDIRMWVSVNNTSNFKVRKIISNILDYTSKVKCESSQLGVLQSRLQESLRGKKYLLVLDDIWNENLHEWEKLRNPLRGGADGSKIIITTRNHVVADIMSTTLPYCLEALSDDDCWTLFKQQAFAEGEEAACADLMPIGKQIVSKCRGVPLAAKILGMLMRFKREENEWLYVQKSELWNLHDDSIFSVLILSYNHLPPYLKRCFVYCAVFPKNYEINKEKLIHQWVAEGLIQSPVDEISSKKMEDTGNEYFKDLLSFSFFQGVRKCDDGGIIEFKMHNLIHDLAKYIAGSEILIMRHNGPPVSLSTHAQTRHVSVEGSLNSLLPFGALCGAKKLRTLNLLSPGDDSEKALSTLIPHLRHLRVLNLSGCGIRRLHKSIGDLIFLRYLDLSNTRIQRLAETVCQLCNLQTLNLSGCNDLMELPSGMSNLINLRHLNIKGCGRLVNMPANIGKLKNLQTLPIFIVGRALEESLFQLVHLELRGELQIKHLGNVGNIVPDLCLEYKQLHSLGLSWEKGDEQKLDHYSSRETAEGYQSCNVENVISCLLPNRNLKSLSLNGYSGVMFPQWIMNHVMLPNLTEVALINCRKCENLPTLGQLPLLKVLIMQGMETLVKIGSELYGKEARRQPFPSLHELTLRDFPALITWENMYISEVAFPSLDRLTIIKCPRLKTMPCFPSLQHLEMRDCNATILRSASELKSLSTLVINTFPELFFLPEELLQNNLLLTSLTVSSCHRLGSLPANLCNLAALKSLTIHRCKELQTLPRGMGNLSSLETLEIIECPTLISLPEETIGGLNSLLKFFIVNCNNLTSLPMAMKHLTKLEHLTIMDCPNLASLPDVLQHLLALQNLNILSCPELVSLPEGLQYVTTLRSLEIRHCPNLMEFPEWVGNLVSLRSLAISGCPNFKSLPEGLRCCSALQHLSIRDCPYLEERCQKDRGEDWLNISHIPYIYVGTSAMQRRHEVATCSSS